jgi:prolyl-tRNA editing enzyme YbaK/EbsC (Cys-tRNA(Pro) deacylase)
MTFESADLSPTYTIFNAKRVPMLHLEPAKQATATVRGGAKPFRLPLQHPEASPRSARPPLAGGSPDAT